MSIQDESSGVSLDSLQSIWDNILSGLPKVLGFVGYIIISWLLIKIILYVIKKALSKTKLDEWSGKLKETKIFGNTTINIVLTKVILTTLKWFLVLIFCFDRSGYFWFRYGFRRHRWFHSIFT